jgi:hypothetical protein
MRGEGLMVSAPGVATECETHTSAPPHCTAHGPQHCQQLGHGAALCCVRMLRSTRVGQISNAGGTDNNGRYRAAAGPLMLQATAAPPPPDGLRTCSAVPAP